MTLAPFVPPIKCQGIKTKLVRDITRLARSSNFDRWIEPFSGSCVVPLNVQPRRAALSDSNVHIIQFYRDIQTGRLTAGIVREFLHDEGEKLQRGDEAYYYKVRERFNSTPNSLDFLFLNRSCFNGVMRFNRRGKFNVPYCHKSERFSPAYITKITNQVKRIEDVLARLDWTFVAWDFRQVLSDLRPSDFVYADPPYAGRHVDYFNSWSEQDEQDLANILKSAPCQFVLSTWHSNEFRENELLKRNWNAPSLHLFTRKHFYHVGSTEDLRHPMIEALVTNFDQQEYGMAENATEQLAFLEEPLPYRTGSRGRLSEAG
jgi:DNA adenine methylase